MGGVDKPEAKLNKFEPKSPKADKNTVLGTDSKIETEEGEIPWETYGKKLEDLVKFRDSIDTGSVRALEKKWRDHGTKLDTLQNKFSNAVKSTIRDSWESNAGAAASAAVQNYADQLAQLPAVITGIANSLDFSAKFLEDTRNNIPDEKGQLADGKTNVVTGIVKSWDYDDNYATASDDSSHMTYAENYQYVSEENRALVRQKLEQRANDVMNQIFVPGGKSVDAAMPMFPLPKSVTNGVDPTTGRKPGDQGPGSPGNPGSPGSPSSPGSPGSPNLAPMQRQQQEAQRRAEQQQKQLQEQQQRQLEEQRRQQQEAQRQAQEQQQRQAQQQAAQQGMQAAQQAVQQGMQAAQQAAQQGMQAAQAEAAKAGLAGGVPGVAGLAEGLAKGGAKGGGAGGGAGAGKGGSLGVGSGPGATLSGKTSPTADRLFPRASMTDAAASAASGRAGVAAGAGAPGGMGGPMGGGGAGAGGGQNKEHKRADYLDSTEHLEEALGDAPVVAKPVVEK